MNKVIIYGVLLLMLMGCTSAESYVKEVSSSITDTWNDMTKYDKNGFDKEGFDRDGYDRLGYNREGYHWSGYDRDGYARDGHDRDGFDREGYNREGYDRRGFNKEGYNIAGYKKSGYNDQGYNSGGYDRYGYDKNGYDRRGYNKEGYNANGFNEYGYDRNGLLKDGYDKEGWNKEKTVHKSGIKRNDVLDLKINIARESYTRAGYEIIAVSVNGKKIKDYNKAFSFRIKTGKKYDLIYTVVSPSGSVYDMKKEVYFKNAYDWSKKTMGRGIDDSIYLKVEV